MSNQWLRLWHDMPCDPKWRTIARVSGQRIGDVMAVFMHLLVTASNATERGRTQSFNAEDVANALDIETKQVEQIVAAMQGRVLDGDVVKGWSKRQPEREDGAAERAKAWREKKNAEKLALQEAANASERTQTQVNADERTRTQEEIQIRVDKKKEEEKKEARKRAAPPECPDGVDFLVWSDWLTLRKAKKAPVTQTVIDGAASEASKAGMTLNQFLVVWCRRGSQGLEASWLRPDERAKGVVAESFRERDARLAAERVAQATGGLSVDRSAMRQPLPFEAGYVAEVVEVANVRRLA